MNRDRLVAWNLELQSAHHALEAALDRARLSINTGDPVESLAANLTLHCGGFCAALDDHHRREDTALFPRLVANAPELGDVIVALMREHRRLACLLAELEKALAEAGKLHHGGRYRDHLDARFDRIEAVMKSHFSNEERLLHIALANFEAEPHEKVGLLGAPPRVR